MCVKIKNNNDVKIGYIATRKMIESLGLSFDNSKNFLYKVVPRPNLISTSNGVKNAGENDTSEVYEYVDVDDARLTSSGSKMNAAFSAFGDFVTASRQAQIVGNFYLGLEKERATVTSTGSGGVSITGNPGFENLLTIETGVTANSTVVAEDTKSLRYIPGFELGVFFTAIFDIPTVDGYVRSGIFDEFNGFWIGFQEHSGEIKFGIGIRKDGVDTFIPQEDFNRDKLDGTGKYGMDVDFTKGNIFRIRAGYLGFAPPTFEIILSSGTIIPFHIHEYPNTSVETHISNTYLPSRTEASNGSQVENVGVKSGSFCGYVTTDTDVSINDRNFAKVAIEDTFLPNDVNPLPHNRNPIIFFRNTGSFQGFLSPTSKKHRISALLKSLAVFLTGQNKSVIIEVLIVPLADVSGGTWVSDTSGDSLLDTSTDATFVDTNAKQLFATVFGTTTDNKIEINFESRDLPLNREQCAVFTLTSETNQTLSYTFANSWSELF